MEVDSGARAGSDQTTLPEATQSDVTGSTDFTQDPPAKRRKTSPAGVGGETEIPMTVPSQPQHIYEPFLGDLSQYH